MLLLIELILFSCAITPEEEERKELVPALKYLESPKNVIVISDCQNGRIELVWDDVDNATHYIVEYLSATDYLSGKEMKKYATTANTFSLSTFPNENDKRFVFRVKAASKLQSRVLESEYSDIYEGAIVDNVNVTPIIKDSILSFYTSYQKIGSILTAGDIIDCKVYFYLGDYTQDDIPSDAEVITNCYIGSNETITVTAVLTCNGQIVQKKAVSVSSDVSYQPSAIKSINVINNQTDGIHLSWVSPGINSGLTNTKILFLVERSLVGSSTWDIVRNELNEEYFEPDDSTNLEKESYEMSIIDNKALPNQDYDYRVTTCYKISAGENSYFTTEVVTDNNIIKNCYRADTKVKSFVLTQEETIGNGRICTFNIETFHELPPSSSIVINRKLIDTISSSEIDNELSKSFDNPNNPFTDTIVLSEEQRRDPKSFFYTVKIDFPDSDNEEYTATYQNGGQAFIQFKGEDIIPIIVENSLNATANESALNDKIKLTWSVNPNLVFPDFDTNKITYTVYEQNSDMNYSVLASGIPFDTPYYEFSVTPGYSSYYIVKPVYTANAEDSDYKYVRNYPASNSVYGSALETVKNLKASINSYNDKVLVTWDSVENAKGYQVCYLDKEVFVEESKYEILDIPENMFGQDISIKVKVVSSDDSVSADGPETIGKVLGGIIPIVDSRAKEIVVTWAPIEGATRYLVSVYPEVNGSSTIKTAVVDAANELRFILRSSDVESITGLDNPLSRDYYFSVKAYVGSTPAKAENLVKGHWIKAPTEITATKSQYRDMVQLSWEALDNVTGYNVYYRDDGLTWHHLNYTTSNTTNDINVSGIREYSVSTVIGEEEGPIQISSLRDSNSNYSSNVGYPIMTPTRLTVSDLGNNIISVSFKPVLDATGYIVSINNVEKEFGIEEISQSIPAEPVVGSIFKDETGNITIYLERTTLSNSVEASVSARSKNKNAPLSSNNTSNEVNVSFLYNEIYAHEVVSILLGALKPAVSAADSKFNSDWWEDRLRTYDYSSNAKFASCNGTSGFVLYNPKTNGYGEFTNFSSNKCIINGRFEMMVQKDQASGYLNTTESDALERISGTLNIDLPYLYGSATITFNDYYVTNGNGVNNGGSVTVNGIEVDVTEVKERILL